jgi:hypothetical protein
MFMGFFAASPGWPPGSPEWSLSVMRYCQSCSACTGVVLLSTGSRTPYWHCRRTPIIAVHASRRTPDRCVCAIMLAAGLLLLFLIHCCSVEFSYRPEIWFMPAACCHSPTLGHSSTTPPSIALQTERVLRSTTRNNELAVPPQAD